jgi:hypothetical protein
MKNDIFKPDGYCGLYCASCPAYLATKDGTQEKFSKESGIPIEQSTCYGCKTGKNPQWCLVCGLKSCAQEKGYEFCFQCDNYPCNELETFKNDVKYPYHSEIFDYMKIIKNEGKNSWLEKMKIRWSCPDCKTESSWFRLKCSNCGQDLNGYKRP